jgi:peptidoglycan/LPS O-acetylase OafA/YrhL
MATSETSPELNKRLRPVEIPSLSGLRAIASLAVVFTHVTGIGTPGKQAVTLFFVLSGFLITTLLSRELATAGTINIWAFYIRRARRLLPAYYVWLTVVIVLMTGRITRETAAAALYLSDYFNAWVKQGVVSHTWSLSVEEHFYLLWPLLLLRCWKARHFRQIIAAVVIAIEIARVALAPAHQLYFFYSFEARADALLMGCWLALWAINGGALHRFLRARLSWLMPVGGLVLCNVMPDALWPGFGDTAAAWCSAVLIAQVVASPPRVLNNRITDYLGARSYSLYLYHVLVRWIYMAMVPGSNGGYAVHGVINQIAVTFLSIGAASLSYRYIEQPFLKKRRGRLRQPGLQPQAVA